MSGMLITFILLVFLAVFLLVQGLVVPTFGEGAQTRKLLKRRLAEIESEAGEGSFVSLLRQHYLDDLSPFQRALEELPGMARLRQLIQQAGGSTPAWRIALLSLALGAIAGVVALAMLRQPLLALFASGAGLAAPVVRLTLQRKNRMDQFEKSLPDAIDLIKRALRAGQPLSTAIKLVGEDMEGQIGDEFRTVAADLNYGNDPRRALMGMLFRVPSVALMGFVTAVLLQRETGGNLAEVLEQISSVIRGRYRFQRRVLTLSAEGRMSAWVLSMVPVVLGVIISIVSPDYLDVLFESPFGQKILLVAISLMLVGILWMRKIIRIEF